MTTEIVPQIVTVKYHNDDGRFWAEVGTWSGTAGTLDELRRLAKEGLAFMFGGEWHMRCFFQWGSSPNVTFDSVATEEFERSEPR